MYFKPQQLNVKMLIDELWDPLSASGACEIILRAGDVISQIPLKSCECKFCLIDNAKDGEAKDGFMAVASLDGEMKS